MYTYMAIMHGLCFPDNGSVERPTVAFVTINANSNEFRFKESLTIKSLWPGMFNHYQRVR